jgi:serine-type D-Ala-D-Ala carboxypeptidase
MTTALRYGDPEEAGMRSVRVRHVARLAQRWVEEGAAKALVVIAARRGIIVLHEAFGKLGPEPDAPNLPRDAIFPLASISKSLTAAAALILVDEGRLGLNRPVQEYLPDFQGEGKEQVMVHHLLTHTSGFDDEALCAYLHERERAGELPPSDKPPHPLRDAWPFLRYPEAAKRAPLARPPGQEMSYSSFGFSLVGEIVERAAGQPLESFARERIFDPLGMRDTCYGLPGLAPERVVRRAPDAKVTQILGRPDFPREADALGGVCSTAGDMAIFGQLLLSRGSCGSVRILSPASVAEMTRNQIPGIPARYKTEVFPEATWGLGLDVKGNKKALRHGTLDSPATFGHGGGGGTYWWVDPTYELVGAYLSVTQDYDANLDEKWNADLFVNAITAAIE